VEGRGLLGPWAELPANVLCYHEKRENTKKEVSQFLPQEKREEKQA